jgi:hypothetical protein
LAPYVSRRFSAPQAPQGFVHGDARDPRAESSIAAEHVEAGKRAHVGFLHHILGFRVVAQNTARNAEQTTVVTRGYSAHRSFIALARKAHEVLIAKAFGLGLLRPGHRHGQCSPF